MEVKGESQQLVNYENYEIFTLAEITQDDKTTCKIVLGKFFIKEFETKEQAKQYIDTKPYELLSALIGIITEHIINEEKKGGKK